jgi:hypothetical protein
MSPSFLIIIMLLLFVPHIFAWPAMPKEEYGAKPDLQGWTNWGAAVFQLADESADGYLDRAEQCGVLRGVFGLPGSRASCEARLEKERRAAKLNLKEATTGIRAAGMLQRDIDLNNDKVRSMLG